MTSGGCILPVGGTGGICVVGSAPGKVILFGEHAVVYGYHAVAAAIELKVETKLKLSTLGDGNMHSTMVLSVSGGEGRNFDIHELVQRCHSRLEPMEEWNGMAVGFEGLAKLVSTLVTFCEAERICKAEAVMIAYFASLFGTLGKSAELSTLATLPMGAGLGSSAAFAVSLSATLLHASGTRACDFSCAECNVETGSVCECQTNLINNWAYISERVHHSNPSGIDNFVSSHGGLTLFSRGGDKKQSRTEDMGLFIIDTCVTRKTGQVVDHVACRRKAQTEVVDAALKEIDRISIESFSLLEKRDASTLLPLIDRNQDLLDRVLDVGHESLRRAHQICLSAGLHMKLTGAGWGGCAYALVLPENREALEQVSGDLQRAGFKVFFTNTTNTGVRVSKQH